MYRILGIAMVALAGSVSTAGSVGAASHHENAGVRDLGGLVMIVWSDGRTPELHAYGDFISEHGVSDIDDAQLTSGDAGENIIPTPGPTPTDSGWEPGDEVTYNREADHEGVRYRRTTVYQRTVWGDWFRARNDFRSVARPGCTSPPCPPQFLY